MFGRGLLALALAMALAASPPGDSPGAKCSHSHIPALPPLRNAPMKRLGVLFLLVFAGVARADDRPQFRALWVDVVNGTNFGIKTPQQVDQLVADAKELHCNMIVAQVRPRGNS